MSDDEQDQIIGRVVREHEKAKKLLAALKVKAAALATVITGVANVLSEHADWSHTGDRFHIKNRHNGQETDGRWPTWDEICRLLDEIESTRGDIETLAQRRKELGV
jgi:hypothetical protein